MFWTNNYVSSPHIDALLNKEVNYTKIIFLFTNYQETSSKIPGLIPFVFSDELLTLENFSCTCLNVTLRSLFQNVTLHELMDEEDILQECKSQNKKLVE